MSDKGQLKELDMTHLERKYLKIAKNCHRTVATGSLCGRDRRAGTQREPAGFQCQGG